MICFSDGLRVGSDVVIDPTRKQAKAFVSHAHSDHLRNHDTILATRPTLALAEAAGRRFTGIGLEYGRCYRRGPISVRLEPAGHMLGSAQFIIDAHGRRIVYTGDFKLGTNLSCAPAAIHECDVLIIDTTFGHPQFSFPDYHYLVQQVCEFVEDSLKAGLLPVVYAYALGKAQEVMKILGQAGFTTYVPASIYRFAQLYENFGVGIPNYLLWDGSFPDNGVLIQPLAGRRTPLSWPRRNYRTCVVSGWAVLEHVYGWADEAIPLSDHASYGELLRYVEVAKPKVVYCLFGPVEIVRQLQRRGLRAIRASLRGRDDKIEQVSLGLV